MLPYELQLFGVLCDEECRGEESTQKRKKDVRHFSTKHCQCCFDFEKKRFLRQLSSVEDDLPELTDDSQLLTKKQIGLISRQLPSRTVGHGWTLAYSTAVHGMSLRTLYRNMEDIDSPVLLFIRDDAKQIFGAFMSDPPVVSDGFYGTGESMLFSFKSESDLKVYRWSGENYFFIKGDPRCLTIGGGDGQVGLWLDEDLFHGRSHPCKTFDNGILSVSEDFVCSAVEAWAFA